MGREALQLAAPAYREQRPATALAAHVECYWTLRTEIFHGADPAPFAVLPDGCMDILFNLAATPRATVVGTMTRPEHHALGAGVDLIGIRFHPGGGTPFLRLQAEQLTDASADLDQVSRTLARSLSSAVDGPRKGRIERVEEALLSVLDEAGPPDPCVRAAFSRLHGSRGGVGVAELSRVTGYSRQHLGRLFRRHVGVSPKLLARVVRLRSVLLCLDPARRPDWAALALEHGYCDQAHLVADFKDLTGSTPQAFWRGADVPNFQDAPPPGALERRP